MCAPVYIVIISVRELACAIPLSTLGIARCFISAILVVYSDTVTEQTRGRGIERYKKPLSLFLWGFLPGTRFALPAARGKMSLNARD